MKIFDFFTKLFKKNKKDKQKKTIGLALGSGGAKGFALVGALKAFEENNIHFDMISGTSIGSVVGAMVAMGFSSEEIFNFVTHYDITDKKTLLMMVVKRVTVESVLDEVLGGATFNDTKIPFSAVCCNLSNGEEVVIESGKIAKALACSTAIPPVFKPVEYNGLRLVDGAFVNSVPARVLKDRGCDEVISISLTARKHSFGDIGFLNTLYKGHGVKSCDRLKSGIEASTVYIEPNLDGFSSASTSGYRQMYDIGYQETMKKMPEILAVINGKTKPKKRKSV